MIEEKKLNKVFLTQSNYSNNNYMKNLILFMLLFVLKIKIL